MRPLTPPSARATLGAPQTSNPWRRTTMAMTLTIERVMAFMGLDVLVARDEGLFAAEGLDFRIGAFPPDEVRSRAEGSPRKPTTNRGKLKTRGESHMYSACW